MLIKRNSIKNALNVLINTGFEMPISSTFRYMVTINAELLKNELIAIEAAFSRPPLEKEFQAKQKILLDKFGITNQTAKNKELLAQFEIEMEVLKREYSDVVIAIEKLDSELQEFLITDVDLPLIKIDIKYMPDISKDVKDHWARWQFLQIFVNNAKI